MLLPSMHGDFRAVGTIATTPEKGKWGNRIRYFVQVENLQPISPSIPIGVMQEQFPNWKWLTYARSFTTVPDELTCEFWNVITNPPIAIDLDEPPDRTGVYISRIIRDASLPSELKRAYEYRCQVCDTRLKWGPDKYYAEVHHIKPLGQPHDGPDKLSNMIVLCPNHHALFDLGVPIFIDNQNVAINGKKWQLTLRHKISANIIKYYTKHINIAA